MPSSLCDVHDVQHDALQKFQRMFYELNFFFDVCFAFRHRHLPMMRPSESVSSAGPILFSGPYSAPFLNLPSIVNLQTKAPTGANRVSQAIGLRVDISKSSLSLCQRRGRRTEGVPECSKQCQGRRKWDQSNEIERHRTT